MQTTTAGRVMLIHQLVLKGDLKELKKEIAKDIGQFTTWFNLFPQKCCMIYERSEACELLTGLHAKRILQILCLQLLRQSELTN